VLSLTSKRALATQHVRWAVKCQCYLRIGQGFSILVPDGHVQVSRLRMFTSPATMPVLEPVAGTPTYETSSLVELFRTEHAVLSYKQTSKK
jgi:hypothetical protein